MMVLEKSAGSPACNEQISSDLLLACGAAMKQFRKGEVVFREGDQARFYHQVSEGKVKMVNVADDGRSFIQGIFFDGQSFGDAPLFEEGAYPSSAIADRDSIIIRLGARSFMQLLHDNFDVHLSITRMMARRLRSKTAKLKELTCYSPEQRIVSLMNNYKKERMDATDSRVPARIELTRQEMADMSGLRVETVIRILRSLYERDLLLIRHGKVFY